jgi:hypothetical protein
MMKYNRIKKEALCTKQFGLAVTPWERIRISDILSELSGDFLILSDKG